MALREGLPATIYRKDYTAPEFAVTTVDLLVQISEFTTKWCKFWCVFFYKKMGLNDSI